MLPLQCLLLLLAFLQLLLTAYPQLLYCSRDRCSLRCADDSLLSYRLVNVCRKEHVGSTDRCETTWANTSAVSVVPVMNQYGTVYANLFCALCNGDTSSHLWPLQTVCYLKDPNPVKFLSSLNDITSEESAENSTDITDLPAAMSLGNSAIQKTKEDSRLTTGLQNDRISNFDSFSSILNFGFGQAAIDIGPAQPPRERCKSDEVYDRVTEQCKKVYCPIGVPSDKCAELGITDSTTDQSEVCMVNLEMTLTRKAYDWLLPYFRNTDRIIADMLGVNSESIVVEAIIAQTNYSESCNKSSERSNSTRWNLRDRICLVDMAVVFIAYMPEFPLVGELCSLILAETSDQTLQFANGSFILGNNTYHIPILSSNITKEIMNSTVSHNVSSENFTRQAGVKQASQVRIDETYCSKLSEFNQCPTSASVYSNRFPRFYFLTWDNFKSTRKNLSYTQVEDGQEVSYLQYENLLYLQDTNRVYRDGEFEFVLQVSRKYTVMQNSHDVIGYAIVCEYQPTNCTRLGHRADQVTWAANKSVVLRERTYKRATYIWISLDEIAVCVDLADYELTQSDGNFCTEDSLAYLFYWSMLASISHFLNVLCIFCSVTVIFTYVFLSELHNLPGYNMINLSFASIMSKLMFLLASNDQVTHSGTLCVVVAALLHYFLLTELLWMCVIASHAYDLFVRRRNRVQRVKTIDRMLLYCLIGWGSPALWVGACVTIDQTAALSAIFGRFYYGQHPLNNVSSHYVALTPQSCWINNYAKSFYIFGIPLCIIVLANCTLFLLTCMTIRKAARRRVSFSHNDSPSSSSSWTTRDVQIFARLSLATGVVWVTAIAFIAVEALSSTTGLAQDRVLCVALCIAEVSFVVAQGSLGILQFYAFVWSRRILDSYLVKFAACFANWPQLRCPARIQAFMYDVDVHGTGNAAFDTVNSESTSVWQLRRASDEQSSEFSEASSRRDSGPLDCGPTDRLKFEKAVTMVTGSDLDGYGNTCFTEDPE